MKNLTKEQALKKIEDLKAYVETLEEQEEWVKIDYSVIPKEVFDAYGAKPFEIMKRKMRKDGEVWNEINFYDAKKEAESRGYRLPNIQEMLVLLHEYKAKYPDNANIRHEEFLGIKELSYDEDAHLEWIDGPSPVLRGGYWGDGSFAGVFSLILYNAPSDTGTGIGCRCAR